jgi:TonB family protein
MKISLLVSLCFHAALLMAIQKVFPIHWVPEPLRTFHVELLRPSEDRFREKAPQELDHARIEQQESKQPQKGLDTISLDTNDKRYSSYAKIIKERLMRHWTYPREAVENLMEGNVRVLFSMNKEGGLTRLEVIRTSAFDILDKEVLRAVRAAAPFPPFPESVRASRLSIRADFAYRLSARGDALDASRE